MSRLFALSAAVLSLGLLTATGVAAAPKNDGSGPVCEAGIGKAVCCKAFVANHCAYVSCCEQGNAAFFTTKHCSQCDAHAMDRVKHASTSAQTCSGDSANCETGNRAFFQTATSYGTRGGKSACSTTEKK